MAKERRNPRNIRRGKETRQSIRALRGSLKGKPSALDYLLKDRRKTG